MVQWLQKTSDVLNKVAVVFLGIALAVMTVVVFAQVIFRMIGASLPWSEEFARYTMVFLTYIGASVGVKYKSHISVEAVVGILPSNHAENHLCKYNNSHNRQRYSQEYNCNFIQNIACFLEPLHHNPPFS